MKRGAAAPASGSLDLLLDSGVYADYGREYLQPSQVDVAALRRVRPTTL